MQRRDTVDAATMLGSGKALRDRGAREKNTKPTLLLIFNDLRPRQRINLEKIVPLPIVDRTMLILDIFAQSRAFARRASCRSNWRSCVTGS